MNQVDNPLNIGEGVDNLGSFWFVRNNRNCFSNNFSYYANAANNLGKNTSSLTLLFPPRSITVRSIGRSNYPPSIEIFVENGPVSNDLISIGGPFGDCKGATNSRRKSFYSNYINFPITWWHKQVNSFIGFWNVKILVFVELQLWFNICRICQISLTGLSECDSSELNFRLYWGLMKCYFRVLSLK